VSLMLFSWFFQVSFLILWHNINWHNLSLRLCQSQLRKDTWESSTTSEAPDAQGITREPLFCERRGELTVKKKNIKQTNLISAKRLLSRVPASMKENRRQESVLR
jgi:hypothetical protein